MAKTYEEVVSAAKTAGVYDRFSEKDLITAQKNPEYGAGLLRLLQDGSRAQSAEQRLLSDEAVNQLRKSYGIYSDGGGSYARSNGSQIAKLAGQLDNYGSFNYGNENAYQNALQTVANPQAYANSYGDKISGLVDQVDNYGSFNYENEDERQSLMQGIADQQPFAYDVQDDPVWSAYKKNYLREGERASANVLAQASAATGGVPSSYAVTAAQQAGSYYAAQLADVIPTLHQNAYSRYLADFNQKMNTLNALQSDRNSQYNTWLNGYDMLQDQLANYQALDNTAYSRYLDEVSRNLNALNALQSDRNSQYNAWLNGYDMLQSNYDRHINEDNTGYQRYLDERSLELQAKQNAAALNTALQNSENQNASGNNSGNPVTVPGTSVVPDETVKEAMELYPDGVISNVAYWEFLKALYGENALKEAGLSYGQGGTKSAKAVVTQGTNGHSGPSTWGGSDTKPWFSQR